MSQVPQNLDTHWIVWISGKALGSSLDAATWLETTRELRELGWQVTLVAKGSRGTRRVEDVEIYCLPRPHIYLFGYLVFQVSVLFFLLQHLFNIDVVLFHQMSAPWVLPLKAVRRLLGRSRPLFVMDTRDLVAVGRGLKNRTRRLFFRFAHWLANNWADGQTAITPRMAQLVSIPPFHLWGTWPSGVDPDRFRAAAEDRRWPSDGEPVHLVYIGSFVSDRNLAPLCRAVERANREGLSLLLSLVGDGPERQVLQNAAWRATGSIRVQPPVRHEQVPDLLRSAHVGVTSLPSSRDAKFEASSPIKLFEYMAAGLPVLASDNACHADVVGDGAFAFWVQEPSEEGLLATLRLVAQTRDSLETKGDDASLAVQAWSWQQSGRKLSAALEYGLVEPSQPAPAKMRGA